MPSPECVVEVEFEAPDPRAVVAALEPDNQAAPEDTSVECKALEGRVWCRVIVKPCTGSRKVLRLRNTVDDLLQAARAAVEAIERTRE